MICPNCGEAIEGAGTPAIAYGGGTYRVDLETKQVSQDPSTRTVEAICEACAEHLRRIGSLEQRREPIAPTASGSSGTEGES